MMMWSMEVTVPPPKETVRYSGPPVKRGCTVNGQIQQCRTARRHQLRLFCVHASISSMRYSRSFEMKRRAYALFVLKSLLGCKERRRISIHRRSALYTVSGWVLNDLAHHLPEIADGIVIHSLVVASKGATLISEKGVEPSAGSMSSRTGQPPRVLKGL